MRVRLTFAFLPALVVALVAFAGGDGRVAEPAAARETTPAELPLAFVPNRGQMDERVRYYSQGSGHGFYFTRRGPTLSFVKGARGVALALRLVGADSRVAVEGKRRAPGKVNLLQGSDPARTGLPSFERVVYREAWPGVDLVFRGRGGELKYEFHVRPGARPADIGLAYRGARGLALDRAGALRIETALGALRDAPPVAYQDIGGARVPVKSRYVLKGEREYGFALGARYDPSHAVVIDPGLAYSTFLGGSSHETGNAIAVNASGNSYVTGLTQSPNFPTTAGAFDRTGAASNNLDVFVSKLNPSGSALVYSTFIGGSNFDWGRGLAIDTAGNAYVTGQTKSSDFPTTSGAFDRSFNVDNCPRCGIDQYDAFVAKLNPTGSALVYSTFLGGTDLDDSLGIALDGARNAYVTGQTVSGNFPTTGGAFDTTPGGGFDGFVTKLNATGSALAFSTRLGGADNELPLGIEVDAGGNSYVGGSTRSAGFPTTAGAFDTTHNGGAFDELFDGFATKLNPSGSALVYSTFIGGSKSDFADDLAIDSAGNAYLTGGTLSPNFPTTPGAFNPAFAGDSEGFATKLNATGSALVYSTFLGEAGGGAAVEPDSNGNAWVAGGTGSPNATTTPDAFDRQFNGGASDAYIAELNPTGSALVFASFLGGSNSEGAGDVALGPGGDVYVTGHTYSADFPTTSGAFDRLFAGDPSIFWGDAFVTKLAAGGSPPAASLASLAVNPSSVVGGSSSTGTVTLSAAAPAGGAPVALSSGNAGVASVPASLSVAPGATSATFPVSTSSVSASTPVTISATYNGVTRTATLTVAPAASGPLPAPTLLSPPQDARFPAGSSVAFDWSDVAGASGYRIQVDDSNTFSAPFVVNQDVGVSRFTATSLPTARMWWRVRAGDGGKWSGRRRFELRN